MRKVIKTTAPANYTELITQLQYREQDLLAGVHSGVRGRDLFENLSHKADFKLLKKKLVEEQGYICCYCNCRIGIIGETTEHILPIHSHKQLLAEYTNLLVSCNHSRTQRHIDATYPIHCDASKNSQILPFTPLDNKAEYVCEYNIADGSVFSTDTDGIIVVDILQLDCQKLRDNRLAALSILYDASGNILPDEDLELIFDEIDQRDPAGMYHPYFKCIEFCIYSLF